MSLRRASATDLAAVETFQREAYAANRTILGVEPLPLLADYAEILRDHEIWLAEGSGQLEGILVLAIRAHDLLIWSVAVAPASARQRHRCQTARLCRGAGTRTLPPTCQALYRLDARQEYRVVPTARLYDRAARSFVGSRARSHGQRTRLIRTSRASPPAHIFFSPSGWPSLGSLVQVPSGCRSRRV